MANVFDSSDYAINEVNNHTINATNWYQVKFQRYPVETWPDQTYFLLERDAVDGESNTIMFPSGLSKEDFLANALPKVNAYITALDSSSTTSSF